MRADLKVVSSVVGVVATSVIVYFAWSLYNGSKGNTAVAVEKLKKNTINIYNVAIFVRFFGAGVYVGTKYDCRSDYMKYVKKTRYRVLSKKRREWMKRLNILLSK